MKRDIQKLANSRYDLLIIGGGINGAALAHMAARNGLKVALLEKGDFASGTSSKSTKLIHGGLRYLENFEFDLVHESLKERAIQLKSAPHLVRPLEFIIPVFKSDSRPLWKMKLGVWLYDVLSGKYKIGSHRTLTVEEVSQAIPWLKKESLAGGVSYWDAQMDDARLCLENVLSAAQLGADVANYAEVKNFIKENGKAVGVAAYDSLGRKSFEVRAKKVVCAVGPWTNMFMAKERGKDNSRVRTTKGVHIIYRGEISKKAVLLSAEKENRIFFVIPWHGNSLIGTTDTDYTQNPDRVEAEAEDIDYLLRETQRSLPYFLMDRSQIITTFAGLRPLISREGHPSQLSRRHHIEESYSGVIYILGGKYTTYRKIAEDCFKVVTKKKLIETEKDFSLYGSGAIDGNAEAAAKEFGVDAKTVEHLREVYGTHHLDILKLAQKNPSLKERICDFSPAIKAQARYAIDNEMACTLEDILTRRLSLTYLGNVAPTMKSEIEKMLQPGN